MSCQQVPTAPAFNPYPRSVQVGEFDVATDGGIWVAIGAICHEFDRRRTDRVFLFGFSRGAFAARSLAGFMEKVGLLLRERLDAVEEAYALYESGEDPSQSPLAEFLYKLTGRRMPGRSVSMTLLQLAELI